MSRPCLILHILSQQPGKTGSGVYLEAMVRHAGRQGYSQRVIVGIPGEAPLPEITGIDSEDLYAVRFDRPELPFPVAGMSDIMPYVSTRFSEFTPDMRDSYLRAFQEKIESAVSGFRTDIVHTHHFWLVSALTRRLFPDIPIVTSCHGTEFRQIERAPQLISHVIPDCSRIDRALALHEPQIQALHDMYGIPLDQIVNIGIGFRNDIFYCHSESGCRPGQEGILQMVYAGKISRPKGVPWLIEALARVDIPEGYTLRVKLAGSSGDASVTDIPRSANRPDCQVTFLGALSQAELSNVFRSSRVFVLPSFYEGLPLVLLEALASGCRIVTTDLPGLDTWLPEAIRDTDIVERVRLPRLIRVDEPHPSDLPEFVNNLATAISRQLHRSVCTETDWASCVMPCIQHLSWERIFKKIETVYDALLSHS
ncbi:MAG TPA: glycosyltransferase family 4 protein [Desulfatirhabdiaceae bacterium]|nr:glycosyltransferase family 4 protein [Desulfatirhabdiaceae bacterium]